ncbi:hypothetical protein MTO96_018700 [Rhipicephalus appendiculatus]
MRKDVQYRDLPGGPLMVKFADELPLCVLCSKCGMLSKDMFEDPLSHAFCSVCIFESSERKKIHCKYENKDVSVDEMMPALDIVNIVMDQVVYCPNTKDGDSCSEHCALRDLEGHLLKCEKTEIICLSCGNTVKGIDWQAHVTSCPQHILQCRHCVVAVPRWRLEQHERVCSSNGNAIREVESCQAATVDSPARFHSDYGRNHKELSASESSNEHRLMPEAKVVKTRTNIEAVGTNTVPRPDSQEASQTPKTAIAQATREAVGNEASVGQYPQPQRQERNQPAQFSPPAPSATPKYLLKRTSVSPMVFTGATPQSQTRPQILYILQMGNGHIACTKETGASRSRECATAKRFY